LRDFSQYEAPFLNAITKNPALSQKPEGPNMQEVAGKPSSRPPMRVLQLGPYPPPHGGVQSNLVAIRAFLRKNQIRCFVINITRHRKSEGDDIYYPHSALQMIGLLCRLPYNILHLHVGGMLSRRLLCLAFVCTSMPKRRSVLSFHSGGYPSIPEGKATGPRSFAGFVLRRFDAVIGVNREIMQFLVKLGVSPQKARLIFPYAFVVGQDQVSDLPEPLAEFYAKHSPLLISVGLLESEYDLPLQMEVLGYVRAKHPRAGLVMIGSGSLEEELRRRLNAKPYAEHMLLCGDVPHAATIQAIARADVMLRTTLYDGDAVSVREALHLGTPVIASDNGMRPAGLYLIPKSNLQALQTAIETVLSAGRGKSSMEGTGDENNLQAVLDLYRELLDETT
jgi:glycogen synthase